MPKGREEGRIAPESTESFDDLVEGAAVDAAVARRRAAELGRGEPDADGSTSGETPEVEVTEEAEANAERPRRRFRPLLLTAWALVLVACAAAVAALWGAGESDLPQTSARRPRGSRAAVSPACRGAWAAAAGTARADRTSADLDAAARACRSPEEWRRAARAFPTALGQTDPLAHLRSRCRSSDALRGLPLCEAAFD